MIDYIMTDYNAILNRIHANYLGLGKDTEEQIENDFDAIRAALFPSTFKTSAMPLIKYLSENKHPHHTAIVTATNAELFEGQESTGIVTDYLRD